MFDRIAHRYDLLNRVLSLGLDGHWRRRLVQTLACKSDDAVLDVATGTADVALAICRKYPMVRVTGLDPSERMLAIGREKARAAGCAQRVDTVTGDAQHMPFADNTFDASCISFGIRNVTDRDAGLREMARVTKPGGRLAILELSPPQDGSLRHLASFHIRQVVPRFGAMLSGEREYRYLAESVAAFPPPDAFAQQLLAAGWRDVGAQRLSFGVVYLHWGVAPGNTA